MLYFSFIFWQHFIFICDDNRKTAVYELSLLWGSHMLTNILYFKRDLLLQWNNYLICERILFLRWIQLFLHNLIGRYSRAFTAIVREQSLCWWSVILICLHNETVQINIIVRFFLRHVRNLEAKYADLTALFFNFTGYITQILSLKWIITITNGNTCRTWLPIMLVDHIMLIMCKVCCPLLLSVPFEVLCL